MNSSNTRPRSFSLLVAPILLTAMATSSCVSDPYGYGRYQATPAQRGALTGAVAGGIIGGIAREDVGGVAIGAGLGALAGAATAQAVENHHRRQQPPPGYRNDRAPAPYRRADPPPPYQQRQDPRDYRPLNPQAPPRPPVTSAPEPPRSQPKYPVARKTSDPNRVTSPYPPNNLIDVEGFQSGDLAIDPTTEKIFRIP